jgi:hypothetical protein
VISETTPVEDDGLDPSALGPFGDNLSDLGGGLD